MLKELETETRTVIMYEAPHRLVKTLEELYGALGDRRISVCRELTKKHETVFATTLREALEYYQKQGTQRRVRDRHGRQKPEADGGRKTEGLGEYESCGTYAVL